MVMSQNSLNKCLVNKVKQLLLPCAVALLSFGCTEPGEVKWEYVVPGGQPLIKNGLAHVEFKPNGTFCTSDSYTASYEATWFPTLRRSRHQSASGKPIEKPVETPESGYALCCESTTSFCDSTFVVLWVGNMPGRNIKIPEDQIRFLQQNFDLPNCPRVNP
jgi:hypothetical protein